MTKTCTKCKRELEDDQFHKNQRACKECRNVYSQSTACKEYHKRWRESHKEEIQAYRKANRAKSIGYDRAPKRKESKRLYNQRRKEKVLAYYSCGTNTCKNCDFSDIRALSIDHINGGGGVHIREIGNFYHWLVKNNFPDGYQVLCMNCQFVKRHENQEWGQERL